MSEGVSIKVLEYASHIGLGFLGFFLIMISIAGLFGIGIGPMLGVLLLIGTISCTLFYVGWIYKGRQFRRDPRARLAWFQVPFWNAVLLFSRTLKWESYDSTLKGRRVITVRESDFGDNDIMELSGLKGCQVLDLQGANVTDRGLLELYSLKHLQCLVVKNTNVTNEGVFRIQQSFPRLWIWH